MKLFREPGPDNISKFEEKVQDWYKGLLVNLKELGLDLNPVESVFLKQTIRDVFNENDEIVKAQSNSDKSTLDAMWTYQEIFDRFFLHFYGVNRINYLNGVEPEKLDKASHDFYEYIKMVREKRELI
jgi:hypothetical protein